VLPASYATPVAAVLAVGGLLACVAGYRLFRIVLGLYGFFIGAMYTSMFLPPANTWTLVLAAVVGGLVGAGLMLAAYFLGVGLVGAGLGALAINGAWRFLGSTPDPPTPLLVIVCVIGALGALSVARLVVILGTALAGSWTMSIGVLALMGDAAARRAASATDVWVFYPLDPVPNRWWMPLLWLAIAGMGAMVQLATSKGKKSRVAKGIKGK
jgi:Domain of unknown function (DUF4203)